MVSTNINRIRKGALEKSHVMRVYKYGVADTVGGTVILVTEGEHILCVELGF